MDPWFAAEPVDRPSSRSHVFVQAADNNRIITNPTAAYQSLGHNLWTSHMLMYIQTIAIPLAFWFKPVCVFLALFWLCYRAYRVLNKPLEELALLLGFDIPSTPVIALAGVKADGAIVHWPALEKQKQKNSFKYEIHLNGAIIDTVPAHESAVIISGLQPSTFYIVRVALVSHLEFSSKSAPMRFRTKPAETNDFFHHVTDEHETDHDGTQEPLLRVKPYRGLKDVTRANADNLLTVARDAIPLSGRKRSNTGRRVSPVVSHDTRNSEDAEIATEGGETLQQLTERLDALRREIEDTERQAKDEEDEETRLRDDLVKERDELRIEVADKEKTTRNLKREVTIMERQNTAAQNERAKAERMLHQKIQDRDRLQEDTVRWNREAEEMKVDTHRIEQDQEQLTAKSAQDKITIQEQLDAKLFMVKRLEDEIKETTAEIKKVERRVKSPSPSGAEANMTLIEQLQHDAEEDRQWQMRTYELQSQYRMASQRLEQSRQFYVSNIAYLDNMREKRRQDEAAAAAAAAAALASRDLTSPTDRLPSRRDSQRSRRGTGHVNDSPRTNHFVPASQAFTTPGFSSAPLFAFHNPVNTALSDLQVPDDDRERLAGGALMSPGTGEGLLPADLFTSEDKSMDMLPLPGLGSLPGLPGTLPGLGQQLPTNDHVDLGPASPASVSSRAASTFASPQASQQNLHHHLNSPEALIDTDGRSIRSNRSGRAASGANGSRFSAMFGIRARAKNSSLDDNLTGLPLGKTHSHSMPRQDQGIPGLDSTTRKRNSSLSGTTFDETTESTEVPQVRKRPFNLNPFNRDKGVDGWPSSFSPFGRRPTSPRPGSTHSGELPRPSFDSSRWGVDTWPSTDGGSGARASPLSLGGWNAPLNNSRTFLPAHSSRRTSIQYGNTGPPSNILEDDADMIDPESEPHLAPIGTKPSQSAKDEKQMDVKLNPNAKDFKSFLSSMRRDKNKGEGSSSRTSTPMATGKDSVDDDSPPQSRKSRDTRSTTTLESSLAESRRPSNELMLSPTYSNSEAAYGSQIGAGSLGKESFMQKITRKSSSSKFSLPTFKRDKSRLDASVGSPQAPPTEDDEDDMSMSVSSLKEARESSEKSRSNTRSWSNVLKIGKKKAGGETPSISELSTASETTGEDANDEM